jgi:pimeloyl-ACP methyl ester carboxylesterase
VAAAAAATATRTVEGCARDVARLLREDLRLQPSCIVGHSFGGKVALTLLRDEAVRPRACWVLDSQPGRVQIHGAAATAAPAPPAAAAAAAAAANGTGANVGAGRARNPNSVEAIIDKIANDLTPPFSSKEDMMAQMEAVGIELGIRHWMTTNVARNAAGTLDWKFDIGTVQHLFVDYCGLDMWSALGTKAVPGCEVHLVRATRNTFWSREETRARLAEQQEANPDAFFVHDVDAGHWLHAEKPNELFDVMVGSGRLGEALGQ